MTLSKIGTEVLINATTDQSEAPQELVGLTDGRFAVAYTNASFFGSNVFFRIFNADGTAAGNETLVNTQAIWFTGLEAKMTALPGGGLAIVWTEIERTNSVNTANVFAQIYDANGAAVGAEITVASGNDTLRDGLAISTTHAGGFAVSWRADPNRSTEFDTASDAAIKLKVFNASGAALSEEIAVSNQHAEQNRNASMTTLANGDIAVTWINDANVDGEIPYPLLVRMYDATGTPRGGSIALALGTGPSSAGVDTNTMSIAALSGGGFVRVWNGVKIEGLSIEELLTTGTDILARVYDNSGAPVSDAFIVNETLFDVQVLPNVTALANGGFAVSYVDYSAFNGGSEPVVRLRSFDATGIPTSGEILAETTTNGGFVSTIGAIGGDRLAVAWSGDGESLGDDTQAAVLAQVFTTAVLTQGATEAADSLTGDGDDNDLSALGGNDQIFGLGGNDTLNGGLGNDILDGGAGVDTASYETASGGVQVYLNIAKSRGADGYDRLSDIENITGSDFDDRLVGDSGDNLIAGGLGDDIIKGKGGTDTLLGDAGHDRIFGDTGVDTIRGGTGDDRLYGLSGADTLEGGDGSDYLYGGRDADQLSGGAAQDFLRGNLGNDTLNGGAGDDDLRGGGSNDTLLGEDGDDFLLGEGGADRLDGGSGDDVLFGGFGATNDGLRDTFVFSSTTEGGGGFDQIRDFENGIDRIDLTAFGLSDFDTDILPKAASAAGGSATRIDFGGGDVLYLRDFAIGLFEESDVLLV